jgi:hypothetical protein
MASLVLDAGSLAALLTAVGPPAFTRASCLVAETEVVVRLHGLETGATLFGRALGRIDAEIRLRGRRIDEQRLELCWEPGAVAGVPAAAMRLIAIDALVQPLLRRLLARLGLGAAVESQGRSLTLQLDRIPDPRGIMLALRCQRFELPEGEGQALAIDFRIGGDPPSERPRTD